MIRLLPMEMKMRTVMEIGTAVALFGLVVFGARVMSAFNHPERFTPQQRCIDEKGSGWRGSMGMTLEQYCEGVVAYQGIMRDMKQHPERY
jgi:hypothetical protein